MTVAQTLQQLRNKWPMVLTVLWFLLPLVLTLVKFRLGPGSYNNYLIYKHVFWNVWQGRNLYDFYPGVYLYQNHYGPSFSFFIAPFALLPDGLGMALWTLAGAGFLYYAIRQLPLREGSISVVMSIVLLEMSGSLQSQQFNTMLCAWVILSFVYLIRGKIGLAAFFVSGGLLVKLYGIVGLTFTPFTRKHTTMVVWMVIAMIVLIALPMVYADGSFILHSYVDWFHRLQGKNQENIMTNFTDGMQDISAMGMVRRLTGLSHLSNLFFLLPAGILTLLPLLRRSCYDDDRFRLFYLAQVLIGVVIFSTSAESPTYVIAVTGFAIWYAAFGKEHPHWMKGMLGLLFALTILSSTDLFPLSIRNGLIKPYGLKALPCILGWVIITYQLLIYRKSVV
jgi:Glycosyltransferase family 87